MRARKKANSSQNIRLAIFFGGFLAFLIFFSLFFKFINLIQKSAFDGRHNFILAASFNNATELISFSPENNSISILSLPKTQTRDLQKNLKIPVDRQVTLSEDVLNNSKDISWRLKKMIFNKNYSSEGPTIIDYFRLLVFSKGLPQSQITIKKMGDEPISANDKIISALFFDYTISKESLSIQIINATGKEGVGNRLARLISNNGGNIISVVTGEMSENSKITFFEDSYTADRLAKILNFRKEKIKGERQMSDIIITIGEDKLDLD